MKATRRVARTQSQLRVVVLVSAMLWTATTLLAVLGLELLAGRWSVGVRQSGWNWDFALCVAVLVGCWVLWRGRFVLSARRVALWVEEHVPSLQYALVTASDPLVIGDTSLLESAIERSNMDIFVRPAVITPAIYSFVALAVSACAFAAIIVFVSGIGTGSGPGMKASAGMPAVLANRLLNLDVRVADPAYAGGAVRTLKDPSAITALVGSVITLHGDGHADGIAAKIATGGVRVAEQGGKWHITFTMPPSATTVSLADRGYERVVALIPVIDNPPVATMLQPGRDTVWRHAPSGTLVFVARATDDIGLANGRIEYTVTTGSGEVFKSTTSSAGPAMFGGAKSGELRVALGLAKLGLTEGAILSVRAVVSDNNTLSGPATSTSDTRTFRVARADEYDSLSVEAAPPPPMERSLLTERMLIISAESLLKKRPSLTVSSYVVSAGRIGADQADLRKKVYGILYEQDEAGGAAGVEGDDEELDPQLVVNRDLKEAYDAMWDAERSLNIGEIKVAVPFMNRAARALDRARLADRLYLHGRAPRIVVNIEKVRLSAKEKGLSNAIRSPRTRADTALARLDRALDAALALISSDPAHFADALIRLRADAVPVDTSFASAIGSAVDAFRSGTDMTPALVRARRALLGVPRSGNPGVPWSGAWSGSR
jgi:hypothetical protein